MTDLPTRHEYISQRLRLSWLDWGNAHAPLLILLHGRKDHARSWDWTAEALRRDWHVVAPDMRGHGDSAWSPEGHYDFINHLYDFAEFVRHLGGGPATVVAHSFGAHIALRYAGLYPDVFERIVGIEARGAPLALEIERTHVPMADQVRRWIAEKREADARPARHYAGIDDALARLHAENPHLTPDQARHLTVHGLRESALGWSWKFDGRLHLWPFPDLALADVEAIWRQVRCPVLLLYGREGWASTVPEVLARALPDVRTVELDGAGHWPHHDSVDRFMGEVRAFLPT